MKYVKLHADRIDELRKKNKTFTHAELLKELRKGKAKINWKLVTPKEAKFYLDRNKGMPKLLWEKLWTISRKRG